MPDPPHIQGPRLGPHRGRKLNVVVVGHLAVAELYGAERSLASLLAAVDRTQYRVSCVLHRQSAQELG